MSNDLQIGSVTKRAAAWLLDVMLLLTLVVGAALGLSALLGYDRYQTQLSSVYAKYEAQYNVTFNITEETYNAFSPEEKAAYDAANQAISKDEEAIYAFNMVVNLTLIITSGAILLSIIVTEFVIPLLFGNGQTLGKKAFGLGVIRIDGVKMSNVQLFVRSVLGKYALETMIPVYVVVMLFFQLGGIIGVLLVAAIFLVQLGMLIFSHDKTLIHDLLAGTVVVDLPSQMVFDTKEDLIAYKTKIHAEEASRQRY